MHEHMCHGCGETFNGETPDDHIEHYECGSSMTEYLGTWGGEGK